MRQQVSVGLESRSKPSLCISANGLQRQRDNRCPSRRTFSIGQIGDEDEIEADRLADFVVRVQDHHASLKAKASAGMQFTGRALQAAPGPNSYAGSLGNGRPFDSATRTFMESGFGYDFSQVRVHTDDKAAESAQALDARAFTVGRDIVFARGHYLPEIDEGRRLIAHELAHVVQQSSDKVSTPTRLQRAINAAGFNCPANTAGALANPLNDLKAIDERAQLMALGSRNVLALDSILVRDPSIGVNSNDFQPYRDRFGRPRAVSTGFRNRFTGSIRPSESQVMSEEMRTISNRFQQLHDYLRGQIRYRCRPLGQQFALGGCVGVRCAANDLAYSCVPQDQRSIAICPHFWDNFSQDQRAGVVIHETIHMHLNFLQHNASTLAQRAANPECYTSFAADLYGFAPIDTRCPRVV